MVDSFISTSDMGDALLNFIGSADCKRIVDSLEDNKEGAFKAGAAIAVSVMLAKCPKYVGSKYKDESKESEESFAELIDQESADASNSK